MNNVRQLRNADAQARANNGRRIWVPNYKKGILLRVIETILPASAVAWEVVTEEYPSSIIVHS